MAWTLVFWRNRSTAAVVPAASASQARSRARRSQNQGYGAIVAARLANADDARLIRRGVWVRRRCDGSSPQFGTARSKARTWLIQRSAGLGLCCRGTQHGSPCAAEVLEQGAV